MTDQQLETIKKLAKFVRDNAKRTAVSAYNSDLVQNFIKEYTGEGLKKKLKTGQVKVVKISRDAYEFMKPRVKIARKKALETTKNFIKFTERKAKSAKESKIYKDFINSKFVLQCKKYGRKAILGATIAGAVFLGGKITKNRVDYLNSDDYKMEICKNNESLLFLTVVHSENWSDSTYDDGCGVATNGYGTTVYRSGDKVKMSDKDISRTLTQEEIDYNGGSIIDAAYFKGEGEVIAHLEKHVYPSMLKIKNFRKLTQEQQVAFALFCYNIGCGAFDNSSVLSELNKGNVDQAIDNMLKYNKIKKKGKLIYAKGLQKRRTYEYMIAKGFLPLAEILDMPIASIYSNVAYCKMYKGKTSKDFAGENIVKPEGDVNDYICELRSGSNPKVRNKISKKTCEKAERAYLRVSKNNTKFAKTNQRS